MSGDSKKEQAISHLVGNLLDSISEIRSAHLRKFCEVLMIPRAGILEEAAEQERSMRYARALAAVFCARALLRAYEATEEERDMVLAVSLCCETVAVFGKGELAMSPVVLEVLAIIDRVVAGGGGVAGCRILLHDGRRPEILVALSFLMRRGMFLMPVLAFGQEDSALRQVKPRGRPRKRVPVQSL